MDGISVRGLPRLRTHSPSFGFALPENNLLQAFGAPTQPGTFFFKEEGGPGEPYLSAGDGFYVMLAPLSDGPHTIHFRGSFPTFGFTLDVT